MKKLLATIICFVMVFTLVTGCSQSTPAETGSQETPAEQGEAPAATQRYAVIFKNTGNPFGEKMMEGYKIAIEELGHQAILRAPDQPTAEAQIQMIEELIAQQVDAIAISGNDYDALQPALARAVSQGIKVVSLDSAVNPQSRTTHINQADPEAIGRIQVQSIYDMIGGEGEIAILSATSQATNQNLWIEWMKAELEDPKYDNMELVRVAYGDDLRDKSVSETEALLQSFPNLKGIISPTTVGIAAAGRVLTDQGLQGEVHLTGLGLPSEMAAYIENGTCQWMYLWNPIDMGYLAGYAAHALVNGEITGAVGDTFTAGNLGVKEIIAAADGGTEVMLGDPFKFDADNIGEWKDVY